MSATAAAAAAAADPQARAAIAGEPGPPNAGAVRAAIVLGDDLHILMPLFAIAVSIFDSEVREVHFLVEAGKTMLARPLADFFVAPIGMTVVVGAVTITLMNPALIVPLELVVEDDVFDARPTAGQVLRCAFIGAVDWTSWASSRSRLTPCQKV